MSADFTPEKEDYKILEPFKMQVLTNFPYIEADFDALTNYELLCKIVEYLNAVIHNENEVTEQVTGLYNAYVSLQNYVNNYFDNLDVQEEINNKLDEMAEDGSLYNIISSYTQPIIDEQNQAINELSTEINTISSNVAESITEMNNKIDLATTGSPIAVASVDDMTDTDKVYVNTTDGKWYYYDGDSWEIGGTYQATAVSDGSITFPKLETKIQNYFKSSTDLSSVSCYAGSTISTSTGGTTNNAKRGRTARFASQTDDVQYDYIYIDSDTYDMACFAYTARTQEWTDDYISGSSTGWLGSNLYKVLPTYTYLACSFKRLDDADMTDADMTAIQSAVHRIHFDLDTSLAIEGKIPDSKAVGDAIANISPLNATVSMYNKFGICGASWDSGYIYPSSDGTPIEDANLSWGANLARLYGNNFYNFSKASMTTRSYLTNANCLPKLLNSDACNLYVITLGGNDSSYLGLDYLGTVEDMTPDYTQNPDTFYGNYARIIENIKIKAPNAKIILAFYYDENRHTSTREAYDEAVTNIAEHYNLPKISWQDDTWYTSNFVMQNLVHSHPTAVQLTGIALAFGRLYSKCVADNYSYFNDYVG